MGFTPMCASELEFYLYKESYAEAHEKDFNGPHPDDPLHPRLPHPRDDDGRAVPRRDPPRHARRRDPDRVLEGRGLVRPARGQHPLRRRGHLRRPPHDLQERRQGDRLPERDLGDASWRSPRRRTSAARATSTPSLVDARTARAPSSTASEETDIFRHFLGGQRAHIRELALFIAPSINSYKRYAAESWAPTSISWGRDNRTCGFRIVGHGQSRRVECRIPGADANPYLGFAALLAAGLDGIENGDRPGAGAEGKRVRGRRGGAVPVLAARGASTSGRGASSPSRTFGERGARPLPQLRPQRAEAVRRGRHRLRAPAHVRARLSTHMAPRLLLGVDEGTTGVKAALFDERLQTVGEARRDKVNRHPREGWVEQDGGGGARHRRRRHRRAARGPAR